MKVGNFVIALLSVRDAPGLLPLTPMIHSCRKEDIGC